MTIHGKKCSCRACRTARINHKRRTTGMTPESENSSAENTDQESAHAADKDD